MTSFTNPPLRDRPLDRRRFIGALGASSALGALLVACGSDESATTASTAAPDTATTADSAADTDGTTTTDTTDAATTTEAPTTDTDAAATGWAVGGTDLITVDVPDDSVFATAAMCTVALSQSTTEGPCYFADDTGADISEGLSGLPMQLCLRVVDADCNPIEGQLVEVWHCDHEGIYSGDTSQSTDASRFAGDFCTGGDADGEASTWYRGQLTTDASGRVDFTTCFPGWYRGRTSHIHFAVSDDSGTRLISQFCFPDALVTEIYTTHEIYSPRGDQDTPLAAGTDTVFPANGFEEYQLTTQRNSDGTLLAFHNIQVV